MSKIVRIQPIAADGGSRNWVFVRVETADGVVGVGEATLEWNTAAVVSAVEELADLLVGIDSAQIHEVWQLGYRGRFWRGGPVLLSALSGVEQALWDIKGKAAGLPVYDLLGGRCRDRLMLYANYPSGLSPQELAEDLNASGLGGVKITPFDEPMMAVDGTENVLRAAIDETAAVRAAIGPSVRLAIDVHGRLSAAMSIVFAKAVEDLDIWFLEEPTLPDDLLGLRRVAGATSIPLAAGERLLTRDAFWQVLETGALAMVQPDLAHCGGVFEGRTIAAMAETKHVGFAPHNPLSRVNTMASAHVSLTTPNFVALEHKRRDTPAQADMVRSDHTIVEGHLHVSASPGLGIELDVDACRGHPPVRRAVPQLRYPDQSLAEW